MTPETDEIRMQRRPGTTSTEMDATLLLLEPQEGRFFGLNEVASRVWALLERPVTLQEITDTLVAEYEVTPEQCMEHVQRFLQTLRKRRLLIDAPGAGIA